jgi:predicted esterase
MTLTRRELGLRAGGALAAVLASVRSAGARQGDAGSARLHARPDRRSRTSASGTRPLGLGADRDGVLHVPADAGAGPLPLMVLLHGASSSGSRQFGRFTSFLTDTPLVVLAPDSREPKWDAIRGVFDVDVAFLDRALAHVFASVSVDRERVSIAGFSDGATYALSLGLANGDLFRDVFAFSPGFVVVNEPWRGKPKIFISHGTRDDILPIERTSRQIAPRLKQMGYDVTYREFTGGHEVPEVIAREAFARAVRV